MKYNKSLNLIVIFIVSLVIMMPASDAWCWKTHSQIADVVYYGLPVQVQENLDLKTMENASNDPDELFHDFTYHSYPNSYNKSMYWLNLGKIAYDNGNYENASYDYGVASHYISDTFSAPHAVSGEAYSDHSKYENHAKKLNPVVNPVNGDLNEIMANGKIDGSASWDEWTQTKDDSIIQKNLNNGASACLYAVNYSISNGTTNTTNVKGQSGSIVDMIVNFVKNLF